MRYILATVLLCACALAQTRPNPLTGKPDYVAPAGGTTGQVVTKQSDGSVKWATPPGAAGGEANTLSGLGGGTYTWLATVPKSGTALQLKTFNVTSPLVVTPSGDLLAISIPQANGSTNGFLSSTDWTTFNSKYGSGASPSFNNLSANSVTVNAQGAGTPVAFRTHASTVAADPFAGVQNSSNTWLGGFLGSGKYNNPSQTSGAAVFDADGTLQKAIGTATDCVRVDGTSVPCVGGGDNLGTATANDVANLFSGAGEYLKKDGTTGTPSGGVASVDSRTGAVTLSDLYAPIDHLSNTTNPHNVTAAQVGLGNVPNYSVASQAEAEAGTAADKLMTPQRTAQAIAALGGGPGSGVTIQQNGSAIGTRAIIDSLDGTGITRTMTDTGTKITDTIAVNTAVIATRAYAESLVGGGVTDGDKGDISVTGGVWSVDSGAVAASEVTNTPAGGISATTVQAAVNELDTEKHPKPTGTPDGTKFLRDDNTWQAVSASGVSAATVQSGSLIFCDDDAVGADDAYTCAISPAPASYTAGMRVVLRPKTTNAGTSTIDLGPGAVQIRQGNGTNNLADSTLLANQLYTFIYDGTVFRAGGEVQTATATKFISNPANCSVGTLPRGVGDNGSAEGCAAVSLATEVTGTLPAANIDSAIARTIASGTAALGTAAIASGACATTVTVAATGVATTDAIQWTPNADITAVTGYAPVTTGGLAIYPFPTANNVNFRVCNPTASSITPGAVTLNWRIAR